ncbi:hypothetical protein GCM10023189_31640 [Nibrella saemangeumensis]|uniref:Uncharacterized protein n=1 Tax=Nibrella saemangeumensis TaxID=1084526 RepID=A0ABP8N3Y0_9BACT
MDFTLVSIQLGQTGFSLVRLSNSTFVRFFSLLSFSYAQGGRFLNRSLLGYHHSVVDRIRFISILFFTFQLAAPADDVFPVEEASTSQPDRPAQRTAGQEKPVAEEIAKV